MEFVNCSVKNQFENSCFGHAKTIENESENNKYNNNNGNVISFNRKKKNRNNQSIVTIEPKYVNVNTRNGLRWSMEQKINLLSYTLSDNGNLSDECKEDKMKIIRNIHENKDFLCSRCGKKMQEPRLLPCLHAMCSPCVFDLIGKTNNIDTSKMKNNDNINSACNIYERCPLCHFCLSNTCFIIPPPHYPLQHKLVMDAMRRKLAHRILCDTCSDEVIAIVQCCVCLRNFCSDCGNEHEEKTSVEVKQGKHVVKPLWEATRIRRTILCQVHPSNALRYYCNACQQICCKECMWSIEHRGHASENAIGAGRRAAAYITAMLEKAKILLNSLLIRYNEDIFSNDIYNEQEHFIDQWYSEDPIKYESDPQNHVSMSIWTKQARKRIQEYARLWRARHILDAISFINELFVDSSEVEILSLVNVIARRLKFLGVPDSSENKQCDVSNNDKKLFLLNQGHSGIYHCCTFCSSGGKKDVVCACGGRMPGGYRGCGHGHVGHPGSNHWSCCGSLLRDGRCLITRRYKYQFLL